MRLSPVRSFSTALLLLIFLTPLRALGPYLTTDAPDPIRLLPPPPALGTVEDKTDKDAAFAVYTAHTPADFARGKEENTFTAFSFSFVLGEGWQPSKYPKADALFKQVEAETRKITNAGKEHWNRARPYIADPSRFPDPVEHEVKPSASYPSGHSTRGTLYALLLTELFPDKSDAFAQYGRQVGWRRIQGGMHTPFDIYAGRVLGQALAQAFLRSPAFQHDLAEVKAEIAAAKTPELVH